MGVTIHFSDWTYGSLYQMETIAGTINEAKNVQVLGPGRAFYYYPAKRI